MSFDYKSVIDILTLAIVFAGTVAALRQLRLNRASNQLRAVLAILNDFRAPELQAAFIEVQGFIRERLDDPDYRAELAATGFIDARRHPEVTICNWFDGVGVTVKYQLVSEDAFMDLFGRLVSYSWDQLGPAIALMRRARGATQYHNFEYLADRARAWTKRYPDGIFPKGYARRGLDDPYVEIA